MKILFTLATMSAIMCPSMQLIDWTGQLWSEEDYKWAFEHKDSCSAQPGLECTIAIIKTPLNYIIRCAAPLERPSTNPKK